MSKKNKELWDLVETWRMRADKAFLRADGDESENKDWWLARGHTFEETANYLADTLNRLESE